MDNSNKKEWTVMFYFASDNPLAPGVVSQLKAIKEAGFHPNANVIAQFDPQTVGTPTHIFEVNLINKLKNHGASNIGFDGNDPFVRNLLEDKLWRDQKTRKKERRLRDELEYVLEKRIKDIDYDPPIPPDDRERHVPPRTGRSRELSPRQSLENFLGFCVEHYPAKHYMLFILGHGVVVGNDIFLFDEHTNDRLNTLSLVDLREVLTTFTKCVKSQGSKFELVAFHSCSVSSLEVAYELKGTAKYMLASQGPAFVGSWPYRQILIRLFNDLVRCGGEIDVKRMLVKIFFYCLYNSSDFLLAGYSYDLCLCNLDEVEKIKCPLEALTTVLCKEGLKNDIVRNLILLAHWRAQSFWQESYTDLYDFCFYLNKLCEEYVCLNQPIPEVKGLLERIQCACHEVRKQLEPECQEEPEPKYEETEAKPKKKAKPPDRIIVRAAFAGPAYQYSHGLSVFFPWSRPLADTQILEEYKEYKFVETGWLKFLEEYFKETIRDTRKDEIKDEEAYKKALDDARKVQPNVDPCEIYRERYKSHKDEKHRHADAYDLDEDEYGEEHEADHSEEQAQQGDDLEQRFKDLLEDIASLVYINEGQTGNSFALSNGPKTDPSDPTGDPCTCPSIKNYPQDTRRRAQRRARAGGPKRAIPISETLSEAFFRLTDD